MADYPVELPANLDNLDSDLPASTEDPAKLWEALRQTRAILKGVIAVSFKSNGQLVDGIISTASSAIGSGAVNGSSANSGGTEGKIKQGTVSTPDIRDAAVTSGKLADSSVATAKLIDAAVTLAKLSDGAVGTAKLADLAVTSGKVANNAITATQLASDGAVDANRAVTTSHIRDSAVTDAKITSVSPTKIDLATNKIIVGDGSGKGKAVSIGGSLTVSIVGDVATFTFNSAISANPTAVVVEKSNGGNGGSSVAGAFTKRPVSGGGTLSIEVDSQSMLSLNGSKIQIKKAGVYFVMARAVGYSCGRHVLRLVDSTVDSNKVQLLAGTVACAPGGVANNSELVGLITISTDNTLLEFQHWTEFTKSSNGFGVLAGYANPLVGDDPDTAPYNIFMSATFIKA